MKKKLWKAGWTIRPGPLLSNEEQTDFIGPLELSFIHLHALVEYICENCAQGKDHNEGLKTKHVLDFLGLGVQVRWVTLVESIKGQGGENSYKKT